MRIRTVKALRDLFPQRVDLIRICGDRQTFCQGANFTRLKLLFGFQMMSESKHFGSFLWRQGRNFADDLLRVHVASLQHKGLTDQR